MGKLELGHATGTIHLRTVVHEGEVPEGLRVLFVSDLHFNRFSGRRTRQLIEIVRQTNPDLLLWGGDYVDTAAGLAHLGDLIAATPAKTRAFAVAGNHDYYFGIQKIEAFMAQRGVTWIEKGTAEVLLGDRTIVLDGNRRSRRVHPSAFRILCAHRPVSPHRLKYDYDLIVCGHLHGCQVVFWQRQNRLYPGRWFYRWNILETRVGRCCFVVSRGIGDTLPVRYNCLREVVLVLI